MIQRIVIQIVKSFSDLMSGDDILKCCTYFFRVLRKRAINDVQISSLHLVEGTKGNMNKLFQVIMKKMDDPGKPVPFESQSEGFSSASSETQQACPNKFRNLKSDLLKIFARKLHKNLNKLEAM